ncbi:MAG: hypothetical protein Kow0031_31110 [Anaerolineae bacterium]
MPRTNKPDKLPIFIILALLGVWLMTACAGQTASEPPIVSDPKISAPTPQEPGQEIGISVDVSSVSGASLTYEWRVDGGEIVRGQNSPAITYRTPDEPGIYNVRVAVKWDDSSVEKITTIRVEAPAIAAADETPASTPPPEPEEETPPTATPRPPTATRQPTSTPRPPKDTPTPKPANTPRPTPAPTATIDTDPTVYDNFNNPAFDGEYHPGLWGYMFGDSNATNTPVEQKDGVLKLSYQKLDNGDGDGIFRTINPVGRQIDEIKFFEAKFMLDNQFQVSDGGIGTIIEMGAGDDSWWWFNCVLWGSQGSTELWADCGVNNADNMNSGLDDLSSANSQQVQPGVWHTFRTEIDPNTAEIKFYLNNEQIGNYIPDQPEIFKSGEFLLGVTALTNDNSGILTGYIDDVRIGQLRQ